MRVHLENATLSREEPGEAKAGDAQWVDLTVKGGDYTHGGVAKVVWRIAGDERSFECEETVQRMLATWAACDGIPTDKLMPGGYKLHVDVQKSRADFLEQRNKDMTEVLWFMLRHPDSSVPRLAAEKLLEGEA